MIIAELEGKPVGYLAGTKKEFDYRNVKIAELSNMGVSPKYRSQGIGSLLVQEFKAWSRRNGFQTIYVNAYFHNLKAIDFYKRLGFSPIDLSLEISL